ncbi:CDP-alcohol phosphatidyltransferase family protein [Deferribacteraceae bacterium V6Fe1]|nr:CDP-alcohol phosphatidyltransferase family protein [Deferribacteraceae bacterium V6Fe1]
MKIITIPNILTIFRFFVIPFAAYNIYISNFYTALFLIFIAVVTDGLDGFIARKFNQTSKLGKIIDPIADKLLVIVGLVTVYFNKDIEFNSILIAVIIFREIYILAGGLFLLIKSKRFKISPTIVGKVTAFCEFMMLILIILNQITITMNYFLELSIWAVVIMLIVSFVQYTVLGFRYLSDW